MWALNNKTSYAAERNWIRDKQGAHHWLVAVKATFGIQPSGKLTLADEQPEPLLAPEHRGDAATSSLRLDSDLLAAKPGTDVLLDACAHAPKRSPARTVPVSLRIGEIDKTLLVHGTRVCHHGGLGLTTTNPLPFTIAPIHFEWAFGGMDVAYPDPREHRIVERRKATNLRAAQRRGERARDLARKRSFLLSLDIHAPRKQLLNALDSGNRTSRINTGVATPR